LTAQEKPPEAHRNVYVALAAAQAEMEPVTKDAKNAAFKKPDGSVSRYADLAAVVDAVRPALTKHGLAYFHRMAMFDDKPAMQTVIYHGDSDTSIDCCVPLIVAANNMQGMKSATTYAKRIGLESVTGIAPEDDDGNAAAKAPPRADDVPLPPKMAVDVATQSLANAVGLDALAAIWRDLPASVKATPAVAAAKDARKVELTPKPDADLDGGELPY
jgi:hypothetical protein